MFSNSPNNHNKQIQIQLSGRVEKEIVAAGSKSEREAVVIKTDDGRTYPLRRVGGNSFSDSVLEGLVGKRIECSGSEMTGGVFAVTSWREIS